MRLLDKLREKQSFILLAEIGALIHDLGKLSEEFITSPSNAHSHLVPRLGRCPYNPSIVDPELAYLEIICSHIGDLPNDAARAAVSELVEIMEQKHAIGWKIDTIHNHLREEFKKSTALSSLRKILKKSPEDYLEDYKETINNIIEGHEKYSGMESSIEETLEDSYWETELKFELPVQVQSKRLGDFIALHHSTWVFPIPELIQLLKAPGGADGFDSWVDKQSRKLQEQPSNDYIATAFGHEAQRLPVGDAENGLREVRHRFAKVLVEELSRVREGRANPSEVRPCILAATEKAFRQALGETRRAANDVTLWDHSYSVASLYKAALAKILLEEKWTDPEKIHWRILRISFDGLGFLSQAHHVPDLLGRRQALDDALDAIKREFEVTYPVGNEIYRDENGSAFLVPALGEDSAQKTLQRDLAEHIRELVSSILGRFTLGEELTPCIYWNGGEQGQGVREEMPEAFGETLREAPRPLEPDHKRIASCWKRHERREICTVCGLRPMGYYPPNIKLASFVDEKKARDRHVCCVCLDRRGRRAEDWATNRESFHRTIWTDEVADNNGRFALVVGRFGLERWLDGTLIRTMLVAPNEPKNPSPARIRRCWETTKHFWEGVRDERISAVLEEVPGRLEIRVENPQQVGKDLGDYHVYDWPLSGGVTLSVVWAPDREAFITADNLAYLAGPEQLGRLAKEKLEDKSRVLCEICWELQKQREKQGEVALLEPSGYGSPAKTKTRVCLMEEGVKICLNSSYTPYIPLLAEPALFMALVPADKALAVAQDIKTKYEEEMARVRDRLPLHLGLVFAPRRTPLRAVLEAGRAMLEMPSTWEEWAVESQEGRSLTLGRNGRRVKWNYPEKTGDGITTDTWYANLLKVKQEGERSEPVSVEVVKESDEVWVLPSRFDFIFLDSTTRRFELLYGSDGHRRGQPTRPYLLDDLKRLDELWGLMQTLETAQISAVIGAIEETRRDWSVGRGEEVKKAGEAEGEEATKAKVFHQFVWDTLARANWPRERCWRDMTGEERGSLVNAAVRGELADVLELRMSILKERPER